MTRIVARTLPANTSIQRLVDASASRNSENTRSICDVRVTNRQSATTAAASRHQRTSRPAVTRTYECRCSDSDYGRSTTESSESLIDSQLSRRHPASYVRAGPRNGTESVGPAPLRVSILQVQQSCQAPYFNLKVRAQPQHRRAAKSIPRCSKHCDRPSSVVRSVGYQPVRRAVAVTRREF